MDSQLQHRKSSKDRPFTFVVCGDPHVGNPQSNYHRIVGKISAVQPNFIVILGDMVEAGREKNNWDKFSKISEGLSKQNIPIYPVVGNHEYAYPFDYSRPPALCQNLFPVLRNELWYSFNYNNCHFVILHVPDKGHLKKDDRQYKWLVNDLKKAQNDKKVVFVFQHTTCFTSTEASWAYDGSLLPELLSSHKNVAVDFAGHIHTYERSIYPYKGKGKNFVTTGGAGLLNPEYPVNVISNPYQVSAAEILHFIKVTVNPNNSVEVKAIKIDGTIYDKFLVTIGRQVSISQHLTLNRPLSLS